jgi:hypothetical protein
LASGPIAHRQQYEDFPQITSWTVNTDFTATLNRFLEVSGEGYKGQAVGGLGGGIWSSVAFPESIRSVQRDCSVALSGRWVQLKLKTPFAI